MAIRKMKKLSLVALRSDSEKLLRDLTFLRSLELKPIESPPDGLPAALPAVRTDCSATEGRELMEAALKLTEKYRTKKPLTAELERAELENAPGNHSGAIANANRVLGINEEMSRLSAERDEVNKRLMTLTPWKKLGFSPASSETAHTVSAVGTVQLSVGLDDIFGEENAPDAYIETVYSDTSRNYISVTYLKTEEAKIGTYLAKAGFNRIELDKSVTSVADSVDGLNNRLEEISREQEALREELKGFAGEASDEFKLLYDSYSLDESVKSTADGLLYTSGAVLLQGWVPEYKTPELLKVLEGYECFYELEDPKDDEEPPVLLKNSAVTTPFQSVLSLYAYPKYRAFDPTNFVAFFFFFIFGFMMQDIGYGVIITAGCLAMLKILRPKEGTMMRNMLKMFAMCGISTIFAGLLFGGLFGDLPSSFSQNMLGKGAVDISLWFSPLDDPMSMLYFSLGVGVVQVLVGIAISGYWKAKHGDLYGAFGDDWSWLLVFIGGGLYFVLSGVFKTVALGICILGVAMIVLMKARGVKNPIVRLAKGLVGLYGGINLASDILPYSRIMALSLSGAVIANVMNLLGTLIGPSPVGYVVFVLMLVVGTVLNLAISLLGAFVHTARLQYIEFFGKFYDEGGQLFNPMQPREKYYPVKK